MSTSNCFDCTEKTASSWPPRTPPRPKKNFQQKAAVVEKQLQQNSSEAKREQEVVVEKLKTITEKYETLQSKFEETETNRQAETAELQIGKERVEEKLRTFQSERDALQTNKGTQESSLGEIQERQELAQQYKDVLGKLAPLQIKTDEYSKEEMALQQSVSQKAQQAQELVDKLDHLQQEYEWLQQWNTELEAAKVAQKQKFNREAKCRLKFDGNGYDNVIEQKDHKLAELRSKYQELEDKYQEQMEHKYKDALDTIISKQIDCTS